jgi:hypothetical protein
MRQKPVDYVRKSVHESDRFLSVELSEARIIQRVSEGGHDVPHDKVRSRFPRTLENLRRAIPIVDAYSGASSTRFCC